MDHSYKHIILIQHQTNHQKPIITKSSKILYLPWWGGSSNNALGSLGWSLYNLSMLKHQKQIKNKKLVLEKYYSPSSSLILLARLGSMDNAKNYRKVVIWTKEALETNLAIYVCVEDGFWKIYYSSSSFWLIMKEMGDKRFLLDISFV